MLVHGSYLQRYVVVVEDEASRLYKEKSPIKKQSMKWQWEEMAKVIATIIKLFENFNKMLAISNLANGDDFMAYVYFIYALLKSL